MYNLFFFFRLLYEFSVGERDTFWRVKHVVDILVGPTIESLAGLFFLKLVLGLKCPKKKNQYIFLKKQPGSLKTQWFFLHKSKPRVWFCDEIEWEEDTKSGWKVFWNKLTWLSMDGNASWLFLCSIDNTSSFLNNQLWFWRNSFWKSSIISLKFSLSSLVWVRKNLSSETFSSGLGSKDFTDSLSSSSLLSPYNPIRGVPSVEGVNGSLLADNKRFESNKSNEEIWNVPCFLPILVGGIKLKRAIKWISRWNLSTARSRGKLLSQSEKRR